MANSIGFRVYQLTVAPRGNPTPLPLNAPELRKKLPDFLTTFVGANNKVIRNDDRERSWYFEQVEDNGAGKSLGYVHYGTFGFESNFVDANTQTKNYRRQVTDVEEIPLFYEMWCPSKGKSAFVGFQSFQGRSCIGLVISRMKEDFEAMNPGYLLRPTKLLPSDARGSLYSKAPVKRLRLIKRNASGDLPDRYFGKKAPPLDLEIVLTARRKRSLGVFGEVGQIIRDNTEGVVLHDGIEFDEVKADIEIGGRTRPVGVFGDNGNAGVIDITEAIERGDDGHPTFDSLKDQSKQIIADFYGMITSTPA